VNGGGLRHGQGTAARFRRTMILTPIEMEMKMNGFKNVIYSAAIVVTNSTAIQAQEIGMSKFT